jgi:hypothetical protein
MAEKEKEQVEKITEEKKKDVPWYQRLSPTTMIVGGVIVFFILQNISNDPENRNQYIFWVLAVVGVLYLLSQNPQAKAEQMISPKEAELLAERECERKRRWEQFEPMSTYRIGPVAPLQRKDGGGNYYEVGVQVNSPYTKPKYYIATVMAKGAERGFTWLTESLGPITGREKIQERSIIPPWMTDMEKQPLLEKVLLR